MKILFLIVLTCSSQAILATEVPGYQGCGEYLFKGVLVKNPSKAEGEAPVLYKVNAKTKSEMIFRIKLPEDLSVISSYLEQPSQLSAEINAEMDGTKGELEKIKKIALRKSDPLNSSADTGLFSISKKACPRKASLP